MKAATLLEKVRYMKKVIQNSTTSLNFQEGANILKDGINSNIFIISNRGKILAHSLVEDFGCDYFKDNIIDKGEFPAWYNDKFLLGTNESKTNIVQESDKCIFEKDRKLDCNFSPEVIAVVPIMGEGNRLGTLLLHRYQGEFSVDDIVLAEIGAAIMSMEIMRAREEKNIEDTRFRTIIDVAFSSLSYSELEAMEDIFRELNGGEGIVVASKIADNLGITRSVIVNALRKFESAGIIDSRSLGMKGTYINVKNAIFKEEIVKRIS